MELVIAWNFSGKYWDYVQRLHGQNRFHTQHSPLAKNTSSRGKMVYILYLNPTLRTRQQYNWIQKDFYPDIWKCISLKRTEQHNICCSHSCCCPGMGKETCLFPGAQWYWGSPDAFLSQIVLTQHSVEHRRLTFWKWKTQEEELLIKYAHFRWNFTLREKILDCCKLSGVLLTVCYQVMFTWQRQSMQETLSHVTSMMESIRWTVQILKTSFTFIKSGNLCIRHEVCQPHFSLTKSSAALNSNELILYYVWKDDTKMISWKPSPHEIWTITGGFTPHLAHIKCPFKKPLSC